MRWVRKKRLVAVMGSQMGKTLTVTSVIGHQLDTKPIPMMYVGPSKEFNEDVFEPELELMLTQARGLATKRGNGKSDNKRRKTVAGVRVRMVGAGTATNLVGMPAGKVIVDELDRMKDDIGRDGNVVELADGRHRTYANGQTVVISTPTIGAIDTERHPETGISHWKVSEQVMSPVWELWQEGTRHEWAWQCLSCEEYFIPRRKLLSYDEEADPQDLNAQNVGIACEHCGTVHFERDKRRLNEGGVYLAPGQTVVDGKVVGNPPPAISDSAWVSGMCSPWVAFYRLAQDYVKAKQSGDDSKLKAVVNTQFGECHAIVTDSPEWETVAERRASYPFGQLVREDEPLAITMGVDVQKNRLVYVIRAWYPGMESYQLEHGEIYASIGGTDAQEVWDTLAEFRELRYGPYKINRCFVDAGYRSSQVYDFCLVNASFAVPSLGRERMNKDLHPSRIDTLPSGKVAKGGLVRWMMNVFEFKKWIHERIVRDPRLDGQFWLSADTTDDYCKQIVAEGLETLANGAQRFVQINRDNHYLDCEVMCLAAAHSLNVHMKAARARLDQNPNVVRGGVQRADENEPVGLRDEGDGPHDDFFRRR